MATLSDSLPEKGFIRLAQIVGQTSKGYKSKNRQDIPALIPISRTSFLNGVKSGKYPTPNL